MTTRNVIQVENGNQLFGEEEQLSRLESFRIASQTEILGSAALGEPTPSATLCQNQREFSRKITSLNRGRGSWPRVQLLLYVSSYCKFRLPTCPTRRVEGATEVLSFKSSSISPDYSENSSPKDRPSSKKLSQTPNVDYGRLKPK